MQFWEQPLSEFKAALSVCMNNGRHRTRFTNSLCQRKLSFGIKIVLSGFTKDAQRRINAEKSWTQLFLHLTLSY